MKKTSFKRALALSAWVAAMILTLVACSDGLDVQQSYGFSLETMPVGKRISDGETAEIRCVLLREGDYTDARYYIRYFQPDGEGELRLDDGTLLAPNDIYPLEKMVFRLYYTARSTDQQTIDVYIEDSFGQVVMRSFSWQNRGSEDEIEEGE